MRAIVISAFGGPEVLVERELPEPVPSRGEVRIRVRATAVNRADLLQRIGQYPAPADAPQDIPGLEYAGEIDALGEGVEGWAVGDRVFGLAGGGTYAEQLVVHGRTVAKMPAALSFTDAAALPEATITAWDAMVEQGGLRAGERVLIHAVGSGVGTAAVQIARAVGAKTFGTARSADKLEKARAFGLDVGVVAEKGKFADQVLEATGREGVHSVLELVGGGYVAEDLRCLTPGGCVVLVGLMAGARAELDLGLLLRKRLRVQGTVLRSRPLEGKIAATQSFVRHVVPLIERRRVEPVIDQVMSLWQAGEAHRRMASNEGFGKVVLQVA